MKWFKHFSDAHNDPDLVVARDKFGDAAWVIYWTILEMYAKEFDKASAENGGKLLLSWSDFRLKTRYKAKSIQNVIGFYQRKSKMKVEWEGEYMVVQIPRFIELADDYTRKHRKQNEKKVRSLSGHCPDQRSRSRSRRRKRNYFCAGR